MHYDFSLSVITRKPQQAKRAALAWCQEHALKEPRLIEVEECSGWTSFSVFSSYVNESNFLRLDDANTARAFEQLLAVLKEADQSVFVKTDWRSLDRYMRLETELAKHMNKTAEVRGKIDYEESKLNKESIVHETAGFSEGEDVLESGTIREIQKQLKVVVA